MSGTFALKFVAPQAQADQLAQGLSVIEDLVFDRAASPTGGLELDRDDPAFPIQCVLHADSQEKVQRAQTLIEVIAELTGQDLPDLRIEAVAEQDWVTLTQDSLPPVEIGPFYLRGSHSPMAGPGQHDLLVDAGLAFGTGHHETTRGCLKLFADLLVQRRFARCLDMGCGTAVLAMAAIKALDIPAVGIELDGDSVDVAHENATRNQVASRLTLIHGGTPDLGGGTYDLIFANILAGPLIELAPGLDRVAQADAHILLAGLLIEQEDAVLAAYGKVGWKPAASFHDGQWALLDMVRA